MALKAIVESLEDLDSAFHDHYRKDDKLGKYVLDILELDGLPRVRSLKDEAAQARIANKDIKTKLTTYESLGDLSEIQARLDKYPELEAAANGKLDDAKINDIVEGRLKSKLAPVEREKMTLAQQNAELISRVQGFETQQVQRTIADNVRTATSKLKVVDSAVEDITLLAERVFTIDESGAVVTKDNVGVTPGISPEVWLSEMQAKRPHWWGPSAGGGAPGNRGGGGSTTNPWSKDGWNMTEQARIYTENPTRADQLAKSAGTKIGGMKPTK
jgi:hypothetical protein